MMADTLTPEERSRLMSRVQSKDTKPEWVLRSALHRLGFRYSLRRKDLPGKPDLVLVKYRAVIFVNGCFWHRHPDCRHATTPKSNLEFWERKFRRNVERDKRNHKELCEKGWRVIVVWECELYEHTMETIERVVDELTDGEGCEAQPKPYGDVLERKELLKVAEEKVRYRLNGNANEKKKK